MFIQRESPVVAAKRDAPLRALNVVARAYIASYGDGGLPYHLRQTRSQKGALATVYIMCSRLPQVTSFQGSKEFFDKVDVEDKTFTPFEVSTHHSTSTRSAHI